MEEKKSYKADLEHRRPIIFAAAVVAVTVIFVGILFIPFRSFSDIAEEYFDDYSMDLDLQLEDKDDMIAAAQPQQPEEQKESPQINKVDDTQELPPENLEEQKPTDETAEEAEEEEEATPINQTEDDEEVLRIVEQLPEFPGGMVEFMKWLTSNLKYPSNALANNIQGNVMVTFIVNKDGSVSDLKLKKSVNPYLDSEALRVMRLMPKWKPGKDKGKVCRTMVAIPVVFEI